MWDDLEDKENTLDKVIVRIPKQGSFEVDYSYEGEKNFYQEVIALLKGNGFSVREIKRGPKKKVQQ